MRGYSGATVWNTCFFSNQLTGSSVRDCSVV
jgi:hypothetical protein